MDQYSLANSFLSSYTGVPPEMFAMGPLNLNKDEVLTKTEKNKNKIISIKMRFIFRCDNLRRVLNSPHRFR